MPLVQQKNSMLADKRFARHERALQAFRRNRGRDLWDYFVSAHGPAAAFMGDRIRAALRSAEKAFRRHFGFTGVLYEPNGERECARRRRQIASGQLTESNGLFRS